MNLGKVVRVGNPSREGTRSRQKERVGEDEMELLKIHFLRGRKNMEGFGLCDQAM